MNALESEEGPEQLQSDTGGVKSEDNQTSVIQEHLQQELNKRNADIEQLRD